MLRRIFATVLIVLGLAIAGAGIASGTIWRADEVVTATLPQDPEVPVVVAGGNVLATVNPNVTVTVTAPDADTPLVLAMGREADVRSWLGNSPYEEVTGLTDWETLAVEQGTDPAEDASDDADATDDPSATDEPSESASAEPTEDATDDGGEEAAADATVPNPAGSDLWIEEVTDTGELTYDWSQVDGRWMMLVATDGTEPAPTVSMTWTREVTTPLMVPGMIVGGVVFLIGLVWLIIELLVHREERRARRRSADEDEAGPVVATTAEDGTPLTRRQIREAARAGKGGTAAAAGAPASADSAEEATDGATEADATESQSPGDWTAIISGTPGEGNDYGTAPEQDADAAPSPAGGATDLDDWVRSGRTGGEAGPVSTYESPAPGRGLGAEHTSTPGVTWRGTGDQADGSEGEERPRRWWQRRAKTEAGAEQPGAGAASSAAPPEEPAESGAGGPDEASEANPQASGASWRQTWGLSPETDQNGDAQGAGSAADADDHDDDEEADR